MFEELLDSLKSQHAHFDILGKQSETCLGKAPRLQSLYQAVSNHYVGKLSQWLLRIDEKVHDRRKVLNGRFSLDSGSKIVMKTYRHDFYEDETKSPQLRKATQVRKNPGL